MHERILVPLDGSELAERILPVAECLARGLSLPIALLHAIEPGYPAFARNLNEKLRGPSASHHRKLHAKGYLEPMRDRMASEGFDVDTLILEGHAGTAITMEANARPGTIVAMSSHGRSGVSRWWAGSVTDRVIHTARDPLLIIHTHRPWGTVLDGEAFERLVVPVDGSALAAKALPHAAHIANGMGIPIDLVCVVPTREEYGHSMRLSSSSLLRFMPAYEEFEMMASREAEGNLSEAMGQLSRLGVAEAGSETLQGRPAERIADFSRNLPNSLVVMTTHGRGGVGRMVMGSVADRVLRQSDAPVLLVQSGPVEEQEVKTA